MQERLKKFLGDLYIDYRDDILGDSYNWGPVIKPGDVKYFTFHHSVTKQEGNWKAQCDVLAKIHVNGNGWGGIGYRFVITSDGKIVQVGDLSHGGSAVANYNNIMFSACFIGDFTKQLPTAAQVHSAHLLAKFFLTQTPEYSQLDSWDDIKGHKEFNSTACPGSAWKVAGDNLYDRIKNDKWQGYPNPQPAVSTPPVPPQPPVDPTIELKKRIKELESQLDELSKKYDTLVKAVKSLPV